MTEDLITKCEDIGRILYVNTNFDMADFSLLGGGIKHASETFVGMIRDQHSEVMPSEQTRFGGIVALIKDHPQFNQKDSNECGLYLNNTKDGRGWTQGFIAPPISYVNVNKTLHRLFHAEIPLEKGADILVIDYCHSYNGLTLSFPHILAELEAAKYAVQSIQVEDPKFKEIRLVLEYHSSRDIKDYDARIADCNQRLENTTSESRKRLIEQELELLEQWRQSEIDRVAKLRPEWAKVLEMEYNWPS